jgi:hypothetical protein
MALKSWSTSLCCIVAPFFRFTASSGNALQGGTKFVNIEALFPHRDEWQRLASKKVHRLMSEIYLQKGKVFSDCLNI